MHHAFSTCTSFMTQARVECRYMYMAICMTSYNCILQSEVTPYDTTSRMESADTTYLPVESKGIETGKLSCFDSIMLTFVV